MTAINTIGNRLKNLRERSGLNQAQLAVFLDVDQSYVSKCLVGVRITEFKITSELARDDSISLILA